MKLLLFFALNISCAVASSDIPCKVYGYSPCATGSVCTPTHVCSGQCAFDPPLPPVTSCSMGDDSPCGTASRCTPTMYCPPTPAPCGGQCIALPAPVTPCWRGDNRPCGTASSCTPTMYCLPAPIPCRGQCIAIQTRPPVISCIMGASDCPSPSFCSETMTCNGRCIPSTQISSPTSSWSPGETTSELPPSRQELRH